MSKFIRPGVVALIGKRNCEGMLDFNTIGVTLSFGILMELLVPDSLPLVVERALLK